jgi:hypothetical protein
MDLDLHWDLERVRLMQMGIDFQMEKPKHLG